MPNPIDLSQFESHTVESDIQSLKRFLDDKDSWENPTKYRVIEYLPPVNFKNYIPRMYEITNLVITDIEAGTVFCNGYLDNEDIMLFDNLIHNGITYGLNIFLLDDVIMIGINDGKITISLNDGYIQIFY